MDQDGAKLGLTSAKMGSRLSQDGLRSVGMVPQWSQSCPRWRQDEAKLAQGNANVGKNEPRRDQDTKKMRHHGSE